MEESKTTEQKIIESAVNIFSLKGYSAATTKEIANGAGVAEGTIFRYFPKKKDILHGILLKAVETMGPKIAGSGIDEIFHKNQEATDREVLIAFFKNRISLVQKHLSLVKVLINEAQYHEDLREVYFQKVIPPIKKTIEDFFEEGMKQGRFRTFHPSVGVMVLVGCFMSNVMAINSGILGGELSIERLIVETVDIVLKGIEKRSLEA